MLETQLKHVSFFLLDQKKLLPNSIPTQFCQVSKKTQLEVHTSFISSSRDDFTIVWQIPKF